MILDGALKYWGDPANCIELDTSWRQMGLTPILETVVAEIEAIPVKERKSILELGCGTGRALALLKDYESYIGIDQSPAMIGMIRGDDRCYFEVVTIEDCRVTKADLVLCIEVLQHQDNALAALEMIKTRYQYRHLIVTLMVSDKEQEFGLEDGIGSRSIAKELAEKATVGAKVTEVKHSLLSTWVVHYENKPAPKRRKA